MVASTSSGLKVAARLSPPLSVSGGSSPGNPFSRRCTASRFTDASSRIAVWGHPPVSTPTTRSAGKAPRRTSELRVLLHVDVVGDHRDVERVTEVQAKRLGQGGLARADGTTDADLQRSRDAAGAHDRNSRVSSVA